MMDLLKVVMTSLLSVVALFLITKVMGHKQMSQLDFFDYITGITIGSIAAALATELEAPWKPLIAMGVYGIVAICLTWITTKFPKSRKYINGTPTILMHNGKLYRNNLKKAKLDLSEFMALCRQEGYFDLTEIQTAVFEFNGRLTVLPVSTKRPATPEDLNLKPKPASIQVEVILDGQVLGENLQRLGLDEKWLYKQLHTQGRKNPKEIFLAVCDDLHQLTFF